MLSPSAVRPLWWMVSGDTGAYLAEHRHEVTVRPREVDHALLAFVSCEICDRKFPVSLEAKRSPEKLEMELPSGWTVYWQRDKETWKYVWMVRCPEHPPLSAQEPM